MSNIIKAEYVIFDNRKKSINNIEEHKEAETLCSAKEDLYEIYNQREVILKEAKDEALKIINTAKRNAQFDSVECKKRAYEEGYNAGLEIGKNNGYKEGYEIGFVKIQEELSKQNETKLNELTEMISLVENKKEEIISEYEEDLTLLAFDIAEKIIRQKISDKKDIALSLIKNVIKDYRNVEWVKVYISSKDDAISIQADKNLINDLNKISSDVVIEASEELEEGSAIIETPDGIVDTSVTTQLKNLKEMVLNKNAV
ncbi:FliH/SctL family protein [Sedimentibacter sp.]|uniref:FliH/SctL family protein n=1 Tax=Sedimentibacter sp. TaxID=1960295 RepID=UPI0028AC0ABE|nr:FliH/SctL family protein [Sedimentibacter sp.]